jgi:SAM-dependent methyltransferase
MNHLPLRILRCPQCTGALDWAPDRDRVVCLQCPLSYPIRGGVPLLVIAQASARPIETDPEFERLVAEAVAAPFSGWDWSWLLGRRTEDVDPPGRLMDLYESRARDLLTGATAVIDLGTGGGERLAGFAPLPPLAVATEAYEPNVAIAAERLTRLGVQVVQTDGACHNSRGPQPGNRWPERRLPFADSSFDLVLASRSAFCPREAARVLRPGGALLTIQGRAEWRGETLADALEGTPPEWTVPGHGWEVGESFREAGLRIVSWTDRSSSTTFHDIGAVVYTLLHLPWTIVDFDLERYRQRLYRLHRRIQAEGGFTTRGTLYLIEAGKP